MWPHVEARDLLPRTTRHLKSMQNFTGALEYLCTWRQGTEGLVTTERGFSFKRTALPLLVDEFGKLYSISDGRPEGEPIFRLRREAFEFIVLAMKRDLQYRGLRDDRLISFRLKQDANYLLQERVERAEEEIEYERLRQEWDTIGGRVD